MKKRFDIDGQKVTELSSDQGWLVLRSLSLMLRSIWFGTERALEHTVNQLPFTPAQMEGTLIIGCPSNDAHIDRHPATRSCARWSRSETANRYTSVYPDVDVTFTNGKYRSAEIGAGVSLLIPADFDWTLENTTQVIHGVKLQGSLVKRLCKLLYAFGGATLSDQRKARLGDLIADMAKSTLPMTAVIDKELDWFPGTFGDHGSCYWTMRRGAKRLLASLGGYAITLWDRESVAGKKIKGNKSYLAEVENLAPIGRVLCVPRDGYYILFNAYSINGSTLDELVSPIVKQLGWVSSPVLLRSRSGDKSNSIMWINNDRGIIIAPRKRADAGLPNEVNFRVTKNNHIDCCAKCGTLVSESRSTALSETICEKCQNAMANYCERCQKPVDVQDLTIVIRSSSAGELQCTRCAQCNGYTRIWESKDSCYYSDIHARDFRQAHLDALSRLKFILAGKVKAAKLAGKKVIPPEENPWHRRSAPRSNVLDHYAVAQLLRGAQNTAADQIRNMANEVAVLDEAPDDAPVTTNDTVWILQDTVTNHDEHWAATAYEDLAGELRRVGQVVWDGEYGAEIHNNWAATLREPGA